MPLIVRGAGVGGLVRKAAIAEYQRVGYAKSPSQIFIYEGVDGSVMGFGKLIFYKVFILSTLQKSHGQQRAKFKGGLNPMKG